MTTPAMSMPPMAVCRVWARDPEHPEKPEILIAFQRFQAPEGVVLRAEIESQSE